MTYAIRPRSGARLASPGTRRRQGNTPPAEVHLRYIRALTSRYAGWPSQPEQGRTRRDGDGRPADRATRPGAARNDAKTAGWRMTPGPASPPATGTHRLP